MVPSYPALCCPPDKLACKYIRTHLNASINGSRFSHFQELNISPALSNSAKPTIKITNFYYCFSVHLPCSELIFVNLMHLHKLCSVKILVISLVISLVKSLLQLHASISGHNCMQVYPGLFFEFSNSPKHQLSAYTCMQHKAG